MNGVEVKPDPEVAVKPDPEVAVKLDPDPVPLGFDVAIKPYPDPNDDALNAPPGLEPADAHRLAAVVKLELAKHTADNAYVGRLLYHRQYDIAEVCGGGGYETFPHAASWRTDKAIEGHYATMNTDWTRISGQQADSIVHPNCADWRTSQPPARLVTLTADEYLFAAN